MPDFENLPKYRVKGMEETKDPTAGVKMGNGGVHKEPTDGVKMANGNVHNNEDMYQRQKSEYPLPYFYKDKNIYANIYKVEVL